MVTSRQSSHPYMHRSWLPVLGLSAGVFKFVQGDDQLGQYLVSHPTVAQVDITFSNRTYVEVTPDHEGKAMDGYGVVELQTVNAGEENV